MTDERATIRRNRRKLILVFLLFFAPAVAAWLLILNGWRPEGTVNHGTLIEPPVPVAELPLMDDQGRTIGEDGFRGRWTVLLVSAGPCDTACWNNLDLLMRVRAVLNKDADRVNVALVLPEQVQPPGLPRTGVELLRLPLAAAAAALADTASDATPTAVYLVDPFGFRMMSYTTSPLDGSGMLKDLRRVLRLSNEDIERMQLTARE